MDRNTIIGLVLCAAIVVGYQIWSSPSKEEAARFQRQQDSLAQVEIQQKAAQAEKAVAASMDTVGHAASAAVEPAAVIALRNDTTLSDSARTAKLDSISSTSLAQHYGIFSPASKGTDEAITIENERLQVSINTRGAHPRVIRLKQYHTYHGAPLLLTDPDSGLYEYRFFLGNLDLSTKDLYFTAEKLGTTGVRMKAATADPGKYLQITYRLDSAEWFMRSEVELVGLKNDVDPRNVLFHWQVVGRNNEKHLPTEQSKCTVFYKYMTDDRKYLNERGDERKEFEGKTNWVAFKQDFFTLAMIKDDGFRSNGSEASITQLPNDTAHTKRYETKLYFDQVPADRVLLGMRVYMGPNQFNTLRRTEVADFERIIDLGWGIFGWINRFVVIPIFQFLGKFNLSYGIIILVLTIAIKVILLPIAYKNQKSSARMRALKPETEAINKKYPDQEDMMKRQQANMELYRKAGVNPMSGCVPMLLQMPILYAMFSFFPSSIELRQQHFLWADDLSSYDSILNLGFTVPAYGSHISLFCLLMAASTIVYSLITMKQVPTQQGMPSMKLMMWMFPVMMLFFMNSRPAGLSYYYLLANVISILQMTVLSRFFIDEGKLRAELLDNMSKPRKKSRWQQRIEEIQKQQQQTARKR